MSKIPNFSPSETNVIGSYSNIEGDVYYFPGETAKYNTQITPRENALRFYNREPFYWVPDIMVADSYMICSNVVPDNVASSVGGRDGLGALWIPDESNPTLPSMVDNNNLLLKDIADWREIQWPNLDKWDWDRAKEDFSKRDLSRFGTVSMPTGLMERLASVVGFTEGLASFLLDPDSVRGFFDRLLDYNLDMIEHLHKYLNPDAVIFSDDWGAQRSPMFSIEIAEEFLLPHIKQLVDRTHSLGMKFIQHTCGNVTNLAPIIVEEGVDQWQFNYEAVKGGIKDVIEKYGDKILFDTMIGLRDPLPQDDQEFKQLIRDRYQEFGATGHCSLSFLPESTERSFDVRAFIYEQARNTAINFWNK